MDPRSKEWLVFMFGLLVATMCILTLLNAARMLGGTP